MQVDKSFPPDRKTLSGEPYASIGPESEKHVSEGFPFSSRRPANPGGWVWAVRDHLTNPVSHGYKLVLVPFLWL